MKKIQKIIAVSLCLVILAAAFLMTSCKSDGGEVTTIYVYNWGEYISDGSEDSLDSNKAFEEWYFDTYGERVKVSYSTYSSNEDMYAKLSGSAPAFLCLALLGAFQVVIVVKNLPANAGDMRCKIDPWVGSIPWRRKW